jgi:DNA repair protein RecN (Recombination protein N)
MLQQLHIENYALIDRLALEFGPGLNLLTGETGSGKSIVVDALGLLLGGRPSPDAIRAGAERAVLCGVFQTATPREQRRAAEELGIELQPAGELLVKRELHVSGRTRVFLNDRPATVAALRALAPWLGDIHGQNEQQALFLRAPQLELLDHYGGAEDAVEQVAEAFDDWRRAGARLAELTRNEQEKLRLADLWSFQKQEIEAARPEPEEDQRLAEEKRVLANSTRIQAAVQTAYEQLYEGPGAAGGAVAAALRALEDVARFDARLQPACDSLRGARITIEDASLSLRDYLERLDANPQRLEQVEDRLAALDRLKRKYGPSLVDVLAHLERVSRQLEELESSDELARQAQQQMEAAATRYRELAGELSGRRKTAAVRLEKAVARILGELAMENTRFSIQFAPLEEIPTGGNGAGWSATGIDRTEFLISPNPGEPLRPVDQVASGGELSRLMLALKTAVEEQRAPESGAPGRPSRRAAADPETARTMVFDEIDAGIGGRVAETVGRKLKALAGAHQVLCVTHLPQIASFADQHFYVEKMEQEGRTVTRARRLEDNERAAELARMLSGARITDTVLKHARDMLRAARNEEAHGRGR